MTRLKSIFLIMTLMLAGAAHGVPSLINYQGRLTNSAGQPVTNTVTVTFTFWDARTGGKLLGGGVSDIDTVTPDAQGIYSTLIGDDPDNPIPDAVFAGDSVWLNVNVNGEDINPRKQITSVGFSLRSKQALLADTATTATQAGHAKTADQATLAANAANAANAAHAASANTATTATYATTAANAIHATLADTATTATNANLLDGKHAAAFATTSSLTAYTPKHTGAIYRWAVFSSYDQNYGWIANNDPNLFGGLPPSIWGDGGGIAAAMSPDKEVLRTLFTHKGYAGKNALVYADTWYSYSSTNSKHAMALFRIRNTTANPITWTVNTYQTAYGSWGEQASVALNGANIWSSGGGSYGSTTLFTNTLQIPANRVSTVIFVSGSDAPSGTRTCVLAFTNNCLQLPAGLEYVDDLDTATGGWEQ